MVRRLVDSIVLVLGVAIAGCGSGTSKGGSGGGGGGAGAGASAGTGGVNGDGAVTGGSCPFTACGGNIVGTWHFASACGSISNASCPQGVVIEHETAQATYMFNSDGTFMNTITGAFSQTARWPFGCLMIDAGAGQICADYQNMVQAAIVAADAGTYGETYTCAMDVNQTCVCNEAFTLPSPQSTTGSYTVSGTSLIITSSSDGGAADAGAPASVRYCVSGNTLTLDFNGGSVPGDFILTLTK